MIPGGEGVSRTASSIAAGPNRTVRRAAVNGWMVRAVGKLGESNCWTTGFIAVTETLLGRRWNGFNWAVLFNTAMNPNGEGLVQCIVRRVRLAADRLKDWPTDDRNSELN